MGDGGLRKFGFEASRIIPSLELALLIKDLESLGFRPAEYPHKIGTSHGGLRKFGLEAGRICPPPIETSYGELRQLDLRLAKYPPPD